MSRYFLSPQNSFWMAQAVDGLGLYRCLGMSPGFCLLAVDYNLLTWHTWKVCFKLFSRSIYLISWWAAWTQQTRSAVQWIHAVVLIQICDNHNGVKAAWELIGQQSLVMVLPTDYFLQLKRNAQTTGWLIRRRMCVCPADYWYNIK